MTEFPFPLETFDDNIEIIHTAPLPSYASLIYPIYKFNPSKASDLG